MKRTLVITFFVLVCLVLGTAVADTYRVVTLEGDPVNVRDSDSGGFVIGTIPNGTVIEVDSIGKWWAKITYDGKTGYVYRSYLEPTDGTVLPNFNTPEKTYSLDGTTAYRVKLNYSGYIHVRRKPSMNSGSSGIIYRGDTIWVKSFTGDWAKVVWNNRIRYVPKKHLEKVTEETEPLTTTLGKYKVVSKNRKPVNTRKEPGVDQKRANQLKYGTEVEVIEDLGAWALIVDNSGNELGYIMTWYLQPIEE